MKLGDMIVWDPSRSGCVRGTPGHESGLIVSDSSPLEEARDPFCINGTPYERSRFTVLWDCGKLTRPATAYLGNFRAIR